MIPRKVALSAIDAVVLPPEWSPMESFRGEWERHAFLWGPGTGAGLGVMPLSSIRLQALGATKAGLILVHSHGCEIYANHATVQRAVDHCIAWRSVSAWRPSAGSDEILDAYFARRS